MRFGKRRKFTVFGFPALFGTPIKVKVQGYEMLDMDKEFPRLIIYASPRFHHYGELKGQATGDQDTKHWTVAEFYTAALVPHNSYNSDDWVTRKGTANAAVRILSRLDKDQLQSMRNLKANDGKLIYNGEVIEKKPILNPE